MAVPPSLLQSPLVSVGGGGGIGMSATAQQMRGLSSINQMQFMFMQNSASSNGTFSRSPPPLHLGLRGEYTVAEKEVIEKDAFVVYCKRFRRPPKAVIWSSEWFPKGLRPGTGWAGEDDLVLDSHTPARVYRDYIILSRRDIAATEEGGFTVVRRPSGKRIYRVRGVEVPARLVERPQFISIGHIKKERNTEARRLMVEAFLRVHGGKKFIEGMKGELLDETPDGKLWGIERVTEVRRAIIPQLVPHWSNGGQQTQPATIREVGAAYRLTMLEVVNSTAEPDGTFKTYYLKTPPLMQRVKQALAWTFDMNESDYDLARQT